MGSILCWLPKIVIYTRRACVQCMVTRDSVLKIAFVDSGLYVDGIPDRLCGVSLGGHYRELGD
ncbi:hypothetical protein HFN65_31305 [Rhizobium laguerreae]|uniref:hypothetical protein n=1 Tax=Rhizobium laguerreae TaxID=1076926 RepID=UPI001C9160B0|nr:hypothetical protein [Rhizobium laguerreae]MBY3575427.1 hypothetical protein [Rhizobium laguerreae]